MTTCNACKFYDNEIEHEEQKFGFCFRYPPTTLAENKSSAPVVRANLRACGEFKPKPRKSVKRK